MTICHNVNCKTKYKKDKYIALQRVEKEGNKNVKSYNCSTNIKKGFKPKTRKLK